MNRATLCVAVAILALAGIMTSHYCEAEGVRDKNNSQQQRHDSAKRIARAWWSAMLEADAPTLLSLADVPFSLDGKRICESMFEVREHLYTSEEHFAAKAQEWKDKGVAILDVVILSDEKRFADDGFAIDRIVVQVTIGNEHEKAPVRLRIRPGVAYKVTGVRG
ncbi:hypothetical protein ACFL59_14305 [Planctomycetota bacterium]